MRTRARPWTRCHTLSGIRFPPRIKLKIKEDLKKRSKVITKSTSASCAPAHAQVTNKVSRAAQNSAGKTPNLTPNSRNVHTLTNTQTTAHTWARTHRLAHVPSGTGLSPECVCVCVCLCVPPRSPGWERQQQIRSKHFEPQNKKQTNKKKEKNIPPGASRAARRLFHLFFLCRPVVRASAGFIPLFLHLLLLLLSTRRCLFCFPPREHGLPLFLFFSFFTSFSAALALHCQISVN